MRNLKEHSDDDEEEESIIEIEGKDNGISCYNCGKKGHIRLNCPQLLGYIDEHGFFQAWLLC